MDQKAITKLAIAITLSHPTLKTVDNFLGLLGTWNITYVKENWIRLLMLQ